MFGEVGDTVGSVVAWRDWALVWTLPQVDLVPVLVQSVRVYKFLRAVVTIVGRVCRVVEVLPADVVYKIGLLVVLCPEPAYFAANLCEPNAPVCLQVPHLR